MIKTLTTIIIILCLSLSGAAQKRKSNPLVTTRTDRYSGRTTVSTVDIQPRGNLMIAATVSYSGQKPERFETVRVLFIGGASFWPQLAQFAAVGFIADNNAPMNYNATYSSTFVVDGILSTSYGLDLPLEQFARVACARTVEMKVAYNEMRLKPRDIASMKALLTTIGGTCQQR